MAQIVLQVRCQVVLTAYKHFSTALQDSLHYTMTRFVCMKYEHIDTIKIDNGQTVHGMTVKIVIPKMQDIFFSYD